MGALNVAATMDALATAFASVGVITNAYGYPVEALNPGEACVGYPDPITFDMTFQRGADEATFPVWVMCGLVADAATRTFVSTIIGSASDVKDAVDGSLSGVVQTCRVTDAAIERVFPAGGNQSIAVRFDVEVIS